MTTIVELAEDRVVEGVFGVARKQRLRTKGGTPYLALELVDPSGRIDARVWQDVELLDGRFAEGDAVRVLGRVERFRDRLQVAVRSIESAPDADPATPDAHHSYLGGLLEHTVGVATICREVAQLHPRLRADLLLAAALVHDAGRTRELGPPPSFAPTAEGRLLGHVHLGVRLVETNAGELDSGVRAELAHAVASHHDARAARTAEAAVLHHANSLDAAAATRPVPQTG